MISGMVQLFALLSAPFIGALSDKVDKVLSVSIAALIAAIGYLLICFMPDVTGGWVYIALAFIGVGEMGEIISSQVLVTEEAPENVRGAVSGIFSFCGSIGILISTKIGGFLFDYWQPGGPFILNSIFSFMLCAVSLILCFVRLAKWFIERKRKKQSSDTTNEDIETDNINVNNEKTNNKDLQKENENPFNNLSEKNIAIKETTECDNTILQIDQQM